MDDFEKTLQRQPPRQIPTEWRKEILRAAREARHVGVPNNPITDRTVLLFLARPVLKVWRELVWPARRIWAGFALVWLMMVGVNLADADRSAVAEAGSKPPSRGMLMAWKQQQRVLAELVGLNAIPEADPPKAVMPRPRSERQPPWSTT